MEISGEQTCIVVSVNLERQMKMERCSNCDEKIGKLEQSCTFGGNVVCSKCWQKLHSQKKSTFLNGDEAVVTNAGVPLKDKKSHAGAVILGAIAIIAGAWYYFGGGFEYQVQENMKEIEKQASVALRRIEHQVAADAVKEYEIAKRSGTAMDAYVHAGLVAAAYLQANDAENYKKWKEIEKAEAIRAGMPP